MANRRLAGLVAAVAAAALVAGCAVQTRVPTPKAPVKVEFWTAAPDDSALGKAMADLVNQFNSSQKEIIVTASYQGTYSDIEKKVASTIKVGNPPAVVQATDSMVASLVSAKNAAALDSLVPAAALADYPSSLLTPLTVDGRHYALPFARSVTVMFYNTRLVSQAPRTWAELREAAADVADETDAGIAIYPDVYAFAPFFLQAGGEWLKDGRPAFAGSEGTEALQFMQDMVQDGSAAVLGPKEYPSDYLISGRAGMVMTTSAILPYVGSYPVAVAQVPAGSAGPLTVGSGSNLVALQGASPAQQQAAARFILWMTGKDATLQLTTKGMGYVPVRYSALADPVWQTYIKVNPAYAALTSALDNMVAQPADAMWSSVQTKITAAVESALKDDEAPEDALATAQEAASDLLQK